MAAVLRPLCFNNYRNIGKYVDLFKIKYVKVPQRALRTRSAPSKSRIKLLIFSSSFGVAAAALYSYYYYSLPDAKVAILNAVNQNTNIRTSFPDVAVSKKVQYAGDFSDLKVTLFQYPTCPFCCKVRAFLDYYGISYDIVEVNPIFKTQLKWSDYKKVPIVLIKHGNTYVQLNDSSMIISALSSSIIERNFRIFDIVNYYPSISYVDDDGTVKKEILNRYFLMNEGHTPQTEITLKMSSEERKWRKWADEVFVHTISPNVYRTTDEAFQAFQWFSQVGEWENNFSYLETLLMINLGALAMWFISKRLKKRYQLKEDVRISLYDDTNTWINEVSRKGGLFHGGSQPNLADLAVYGILNSFEGCAAFRDLLNNTSLLKWYSAMKEQVQTQGGSKMI